jgi:hypothetical protein
VLQAALADLPLAPGVRPARLALHSEGTKRERDFASRSLSCHCPTKEVTSNVINPRPVVRAGVAAATLARQHIEDL